MLFCNGGGGGCGGKRCEINVFYDRDMKTFLGIIEAFNNGKNCEITYIRYNIKYI